jgi:hypothetical protein
MPLAQLAGPWKHAFEIRFLLSEGANAPRNQRESLKKKPAYLIAVPEGFVCYVNLVIDTVGMPSNSGLPAEFGGARELWCARLRDGRRAVLLVRALPLDSQNSAQIKFLREELQPKLSVSGPVGDAYVELVHLHWSPQGSNVVLVVPMGDEAVRSEQQLVPSGGPRRLRYQNSQATAAVLAPKTGLLVAGLDLDCIDKEIELVKNQPSTHSLGTIRLRLITDNLIAGSGFMAPPSRLIFIPVVDGGSPRDWGCNVFARFDGFSLSAELMNCSVSLRNRNLPKTMSQLNDKEELIMVIPEKPAKIAATMDDPVRSLEVFARFILRDAS